LSKGLKYLGYAGSTVSLEEMDAAIAKGVVQSL
jgi:hypothetical protein